METINESAATIETINESDATIETINEPDATQKMSAFNVSQSSRPLVEPEEEEAEPLVELLARSELNTPTSLVASMVDPPFSPERTAKPSKDRKQSSSITEKKKFNRDVEHAIALQERCRQLCLASFFREQSPVRSLGFTSSIAGEGKSFLSMVMASLLAKDSTSQVTLLECNWDNPCFHQQFGIARKPGLAEWLRGECAEREIRHTIDRNLSVIPAGDGQQDVVKLVRQMRQMGLLNMFNNPDEMFIVDLPPVVTSAYGALAASLVESVVIVLRAGVTTDLMISETYEQLRHLSVQGVILNQVESRIPRWIRQIL